MKIEYPNYRLLAKKGKGTDFLEEQLSKKDKKIFDDYMAYLVSKGAGKQKMVDYRMYFLQFRDIIEKPLDKLTPKDIIAFWGLVNQDQARQIPTKNSIKIAVKRFVKWYYTDNLKMRDCVEDLKLKHQIVNEQKINKQNLITPEELELLLRSADTIRLKCFVSLLYESAGRPHEIRTAKWGAVNWNDETITLYASKTRKARTLPIKNSIAHLRRWFKENTFSDLTDKDYIFCSPYDRNEPIGKFQVGYWLRGLGKKAGIQRPIYAYLFRHSRITELKTKGIDDLDRKKFAGHSLNSKMQGVYVSMDNDDMVRSILDKIYNAEELTTEQKHEYEKRIEELEAHNKKLEQNYQYFRKDFDMMKKFFASYKEDLKNV